MALDVKDIPLGFCERDGGKDDEGLIALEKIPFGSPVVATTNRQVRLAKETDDDITGFATIPRCRTVACISEEYKTAYQEGEIVNVVKSRGVISIKHDQEGDLKQNEVLYFKAGKLAKGSGNRPIVRVEKILSKEDKKILAWVE